MKYFIPLLLVFFTGATGLIYQVTWQKYLSINLGSHASATTLVLSVFFLSLSSGYFVIGKWLHKPIKNKFLAYGILEGLIGVYSIFSPNYFHFLNSTFNTVGLSFEATVAYNIFVTTLFIGFPTFLMGGTIPVLTLALSSRFDVSHRMHSLIYGINTLGAFLGTLLAGFVLIESWGLPLTLMNTGFLNITLAIITYFLASKWKSSYMGFQIQAHETTSTKGAFRINRWVILFVSFFSGFYVFSIENLIIRMAGISLGSSTYTYSIVVASFIFAIAFGSLWVSKLRYVSLIRIIATQSILFLTTLFLYFSIEHWPTGLFRLRSLFYQSYFNFSFYWGAVCLFFTLVLLIPIGLMGMNLPLLFGYLRNSKENLASTVGQIYAINSLGSVLGALIGGYYLLKFFDGSTVFKISIVFIGLTLLALLWVSKNKTLFFKIFGTSVALTTLSIVTFVPNWKNSSFVPSYFSAMAPRKTKSIGDWTHNKIKKKKIVFFEDDPNTSVHVTESINGKDLSLWVNAKPDATTDGDWTTRTFTGLYPLTLAPKIENIFIVGLGAGLSAGISSHFKETKSIEIAEISSGVINALPLFNEFNFDLKSRIDKIQITNGDAYKILSNTDKVYDVIMSEPSNPWVTGVEKLFTRDFLERAASRLTPSGVYSQWFPLFSVDEELFLTILNTYRSVFGYVTVWSSKGSAIAIIASKSEIKIDYETLEKRYFENKEIYQSVELDSPTAILANQTMPPGLVYLLTNRFEKIHTLENPILEFAAGKHHFVGYAANVENLLKHYMVKPISKNLDSMRYLYQTLGRKLSPEFYSRGIEFFKNESPLFKNAKWHLEYDFNQTYPSHPSAQMKKEGKAQLEFLIGSRLSLDLPNEEEKRMANLQKTFKRFLDAKIALLPVSLEPLLKLVPENCESKDCLKLKQGITTEIRRNYQMEDQKDMASVNKNFDRDVRSEEARAKQIEDAYKKAIR